MEIKHIEDRTVEELMTHGVVTVPESAKVIDVIRILSEGRIHAVVVVDKKCMCCAAGVVSEIDIPKAFGRDLGEVTAKEIMSSPVRSIDAKASINDAAKIMRENGFERLVILDENNFPRGIISVTDIIREIETSYFK